MGLRIGDTAPDFEADSTQGRLPALWRWPQCVRGTLPSRFGTQERAFALVCEAPGTWRQLSRSDGVSSENARRTVGEW